MGVTGSQPTCQAGSLQPLHVRSEGGVKEVRAGRRQGISSKRRAALVKDTLEMMENQRAAGKAHLHGPSFLPRLVGSIFNTELCGDT